MCFNAPLAPVTLLVSSMLTLAAPLAVQQDERIAADGLAKLYPRCEAVADFGTLAGDGLKALAGGRLEFVTRDSCIQIRGVVPPGEGELLFGCGRSASGGVIARSVPVVDGRFHFPFHFLAGTAGTLGSCALFRNGQSLGMFTIRDEDPDLERRKFLMNSERVPGLSMASLRGDGSVVPFEVIEQAMREHRIDPAIGLEQVAAAIRRKAPGDREAVELINRFLIDVLRYDAGGSRRTDRIDSNPMWESKVALCQEYAGFFCGMARAIGIPCKVMTGFIESTAIQGSHSWNEVLVDGAWKLVDPTLGDTDGTSWLPASIPEIKRTYFLNDPKLVSSPGQVLLKAGRRTPKVYERLPREGIAVTPEERVWDAP